MKQFFSVALVAILSFSFGTDLLAQKKFDEGKIVFEVTDVKSQEPTANMIKGSTFAITFDDDNLLAKVDMMGGMMAMTFLMSEDAKVPTMLMDMMGQKIQLEISEEDMGETDMDPEKMDLSDVQVKYVGGTKEIAGYNCRTANVTVEGQTFQMFTTDKIKIDNDMAEKVVDHFGGFPLGMMVDAEGTAITIMAKSVDSRLDKSAFKLNTEGYQKMTPEEFGKQMGGFGF